MINDDQPIYHEITKKIAETIDKSANQLPPLIHQTEKEWKKIHGSHLINQGIKFLPNGEHISYDEFYDIEVPKKINHRLALRKVYEREGMRGVVNYCQLVRGLVAKAKAEQKEAKLKNSNLDPD